MGHLQIAVIVKSDEDLRNQSNREYLVVTEDGKALKFFEVEGLSINGGFEFNSFLDRIIKFLELNENLSNLMDNDKSTHSNAELNKVDLKEFHSIQPFKTSRRNPAATSYKYSLTRSQSEHINKKLSQNEGQWKTLRWIKEEDLLHQRGSWAANQKFIFDSETPFHYPKFSNSIRASLRNLAEARRTGKLVIFAGAGVSIDSGGPNWGDLIDSLKRDLDTDLHDKLEIPYEYQKERGKKEYYDKVSKALGVLGSGPNPIHNQIMALKALHVITTNYDPFFDDLIANNNYRYSVVKKDNDLPYSQYTSMYVKMHGDLLEKNIVLTKQDYEAYSQNFPLIQGFVQGIFASKLVLFVGFSMTDDNLLQIIKSVTQVLKGDSPRPYLFSPEIKIKRDNNIHSEEYAFKEIKIISFENAITEYYDQISKADDSIKLNKLSEKGKNVYRFLRVLEEYDPVSDGLEDMDVESQLVESLKRFNSLNSIPPRIFENILPFRLKRQALNEQSSNAKYGSNAPFALETLNENLLNALQAKTDDQGILEIKSEDCLKDKFEIEFHKSLNLIYNSCIHSIIRKNDTHSPSIKLKQTHKTDTCNCVLCLYDRMQLDTVLEQLEGNSSKLLCKTSFVADELLLAYGFFHTGQYVKAFYTLEEVKNRALRTNNHVIYFLASYNQKLLYSFTGWMNNRNYNEEQLEQIQERISQIDLDNIVSEALIDDVVRDTLKDIRDNKVFKDAESEIKGRHQEIIKIYKGYRKGGFFSMGSPNWYLAETSMYRLFKFYHSNLLYNVRFNYFINLTEVYVECMLASFATSNEYQQRMQSFTIFFTWFSVRYCPPKKFAKLFKDYKIKHLNFEKQNDAINQLIESFANLCESSYSETTFLNRGVFAKPKFERALSESEMFAHYTKNLFNNLLIVFIHLELSGDQIIKLSTLALNSVETSKNFRAHGDLQYFSEFFIHHIKEITPELTTRLLNFILSDNIWPDAIVPQICSAVINQQKTEAILDENFLKLILERSSKRPSHDIRLEDLIPFYPLLKTKEKEKFKVELKPGFERTENVRSAYYWGVWTPNTDVELFERFTTAVVCRAKEFPDVELSDNGLPMSINNFEVWNDLIFLSSRVYQFDLWNEKFVSELITTVNSSMFKWVFAPFTFDYSKFNVRWILAFNSEHFTKKLNKHKPLVDSIDASLTKEYNAKVAEVYYTKYR